MLFGGVVATILLLLYAVTMSSVIYSVACDRIGCSNKFLVTDGMVFVLTTVGGLVSALVVSHLAISQPGEHLGHRLLKDGSELVKQRVSIFVTLYLLVWMVVGFSALVVGVMLYPNVNETLTDVGTTWLGLAVAAGYSYFGIQQPSTQ
jgi:hypothetical protein